MATNAEIRAYAKKHGFTRSEAKKRLNEKEEQIDGIYVSGRFKEPRLYKTDLDDLFTNHSLFQVMQTPFGLSNRDEGPTSLWIWDDARVSDFPLFKCMTELGTTYASTKKVAGPGKIKEWVVSVVDRTGTREVMLSWVSHSCPDIKTAKRAFADLLDQIDESDDVWAFVEAHWDVENKVINGNAVIKPHKMIGGDIGYVSYQNLFANKQAA